MIDFFEHFIIDEATGEPRCFSPLSPPHYGTTPRVFASSWQSGYDAKNAFASHVGKPWTTQFYNASSGDSAWLGVDFLQDVTVRCIKVYQSSLVTHDGKAR